MRAGSARFAFPGCRSATVIQTVRCMKMSWIAVSIAVDTLFCEVILTFGALVALTDGHRVYFDANNLTLFHNTGIVTKNTNGTWEILCGAVLTAKTEHAVEKICSFLGFA